MICVDLYTHRTANALPSKVQPVEEMLYSANMRLFWRKNLKSYKCGALSV